jgi:hypothetical protein
MSYSLRSAILWLMVCAVATETGSAVRYTEVFFQLLLKFENVFKWVKIRVDQTYYRPTKTIAGYRATLLCRSIYSVAKVSLA